MDKTKSSSNFLMYSTKDGKIKVTVNFDLNHNTVWLNQTQMAELFDTSIPNINMHIKNIYTEAELEQGATIKDFLIVRMEGNRSIKRNVEHYNLDVIISVGYRVKSLRGTQFRIWATQILHEFIKKGFALKDGLLKEAGGGNYFKELLERIRDIRSSEKVLYRQVLDLFATSIDYDGKSETAQTLFKAIQNKFHYATHGNTAAEIISKRANAELPFMGLTVFKGTRPTKNEVLVAKNYLSEKELKILNRLVSAYFDFAEIMALKEKSMYMKDWLAKLDAFITLNEQELLDSSGTISHLSAEEKALKEYEEYKTKPSEELTQVEKDFLENVNRVYKMLNKK